MIGGSENDWLFNAPHTVKMTPAAQEASEVFGDVAALCNRVESLVEQLVGPESAQDTCSGEAPLPIGVFPTLRDAARGASLRVRRAHSALNRLAEEDLG